MVDVSVLRRIWREEFDADAMFPPPTPENRTAEEFELLSKQHARHAAALEAVRFDQRLRRAVSEAARSKGVQFVVNSHDPVQSDRDDDVMLWAASRYGMPLYIADELDITEEVSARFREAVRDFVRESAHGQ
ncbi:MAG: hypothetical protein KF774_10005 [Planctomyces sp.]|nr:hypothetical protein [Planctomyces sp.]